MYATENESGQGQTQGEDWLELDLYQVVTESATGHQAGSVWRTVPSLVDDAAVHAPGRASSR